MSDAPRPGHSDLLQQLTFYDMSNIVWGMSPKTPRNLHMQSLYLEPDKAGLLDALAKESRIPKAVLLREAVDDLLVKWKRSRATTGLPRNVHTARKVKRPK